MPSAWGESWGQAWGVSWGDTGGAPPPPPPAASVAPSPGGSRGGFWERQFRETRRDRVRKAPDQEEIDKIIQEVAAEQVARLERDDQKRFEQLERELEFRGVEWEARYLEALNVRRELLIDQEIERLLRQKLDQDNQIILILMALI